MMSPRSDAPCSLAHLRASLIAVSLASAPELVKKTRSAKEWSHRSLARWICCGMWKMLETWSSVAACSRIVPTTFGWQWPSAVTAMPPVKSRYSLPSESHTRTPSPRTSATGLRLANVIRCLSDHSISCLVSTALILSVREPGRWSSQDDLGADAFLGQDFEQDGVGHPAVDNVSLLGAASHRAERRLHLREHPAVDDAGLDQPLRLALGEGGDQPAILPGDAGDVGQVDQLLRGERGSDLPRHQIGVDIVRLPGGPDSDGGHHGDEAVFLEETDRRRVDRLHLPHQADVGQLPVRGAVQALLRADQV